MRSDINDDDSSSKYCGYDVEEGITRTAALKSKLKQLEVDYGSLVDLHSQLKNGQPDQVAALVNRIRAEDFPEVRAPLEQGSITGDGHVDEAESNEDGTSEANWSSLHTPPTGFGEMQQNPFPSNAYYTGVPGQIPIDPALAGLDPQLQQYTHSNQGDLPQNNMIASPYAQDPSLNVYGLQSPTSGTPMSARTLFNSSASSMLRSNLPIVRQGFALHSRSTPEACSVYSEAQVESLISDIEMRADHEITRAHLCELSSIAAVATQFVRAHLQPGVVEFFYDAAKHFFEDCMQSPLPHLVPLKVCGMLALSNILSKSFLAFVYIDLGLSLAKSLDDPPLAMSQNQLRPDFQEAKRVRGILLALGKYAQEFGGLDNPRPATGGSGLQSQDTWSA
ncbi:hypothetical protein Q7P37_006829 [Cladosporium fusiforme]